MHYPGKEYTHSHSFPPYKFEIGPITTSQFRHASRVHGGKWDSRTSQKPQKRLSYLTIVPTS